MARAGGGGIGLRVGGGEAHGPEGGAEVVGGDGHEFGALGVEAGELGVQGGEVLALRELPAVAEFAEIAGERHDGGIDGIGEDVEVGGLAEQAGAEPVDDRRAEADVGEGHHGGGAEAHGQNDR